ncbi:MAG: tetratricopeptide repeat protein [Planctomycetes bacterium]|nr:tetratricopeptide repeat protein [Planctomycetota bacterium]
MMLLIAGLTASAARGEDLVAAYTEGAAALREGRWLDADAGFTRVLARWPEQADALALAGMARYHIGRYRAATEALHAALDHGTRYEARAWYYLGLAHNALHETEDARDAFHELASRFPRSPESAQIATLAPATSAGTTCSLLAVANLTYDTNPRRYQPGPGLSSSDPDWFTFAFASLTVPLPDSSVEFKGVFSWTNYLATDDLDLYTAGAEVAGRIASDAASFVPRYAAQGLWLDGGEFFGMKHQASLVWHQDWGAGISSEATPSFSLNRYANRYNGLDGVDSALRTVISWNAREGGLLRRIALTGGIDENLTYARYEGWFEWDLEGSVRCELPWRATLDLAAGVRDRGYRAPSPVQPGTIRRDIRLAKTGTVTRPVGDLTHVQLTVSHADNESNVSDYTYRQWLAGVSVIIAY